MNVHARLREKIASFMHAALIWMTARSVENRLFNNFGRHIFEQKRMSKIQLQEYTKTQ